MVEINGDYLMALNLPDFDQRLYNYFRGGVCLKTFINFLYEAYQKMYT